MPLPVIANVYRVTLNWNRVGAIRPVNVLNFVSTGSATHVGSVISGAFTSGMFDCMRTDAILNNLSILPLDGVSGTITYSGFSVTGNAGTGDFEPSTCAVVSLKTGLRGPKHRGRVFIGPVAQSKDINGTLADAGTIQTSWNTFATAIAAATPTVNLGVASYKFASFQDVATITCDSVVGVQRRRNNQSR